MIQLRPDQSDVKQGVYQEWNNGHSVVLAVMPTGAGKSIVTTDILLDGHNQGLNEIVIAHRNELVGQMAMHVARRGIKHRVIGSKPTVAAIIQEQRTEFGKSFVNPDAKCAVGSVQTITARADELRPWAAQVDRWTMDECFVAGTMIATPHGEVPIEQVRVGDNVISWDEANDAFVTRKVLRLFKNPMPDTIVDISTCGRTVRCTPNHPFWTGRGWIDAKDLVENDDLYVYMCRVPRSVHNGNRAYCISGTQTWSRVLQPQVWAKIQGSPSQTSREEATQDQRMSGVFVGTRATTRENMLSRVRVGNSFANHGSYKPTTCVRTHDQSQSDEACGHTSQSVGYLEGVEPQAVHTGWEWEGVASGGTTSDRHADMRGVRASICHQDGCSSRNGLSDMLQTGHGAPAFQDRCRGGRQVSYGSITTGAGSSQGRVFAMQRVESVTIHQRADIDRLHDGHVYNFEVDEHHTYVANGIVTHNCHHTLKDNTWGKAVRLFTNAKGLGVTACPARADGMGLGRHADGLIDAMVIGTSMRWLIDNGALSDYEFACPESDMIVEDSDFAPSGDLSPAKGRVAAQKSHIVGDVVEQYVKRAPGRRAICFATDVETANDMAARFTAVGVPAASVSAKSDAGYRREMIKRFKSGIIHVLVNVDLFDEGFDLPACDVVIMARPTGSLNKYLQMCGRAMRRDPANPGKIALIIDHVSNFKRHLMPDKPHAWTLDRREKRAKKAPDPDDIPLTACRECSRPYERALPACPYCGAVPPAPEGARTLEQVDGDLVLLDRDTLARLRAAAEMESPAAIEGRVSAVAGPVAGRGAANRQMDKISARAHLDLCVAQWAAVRRTMGEDDRVIHRRLYLATGMSLLEMQAQDRQTMERFAGVVESWYQ